MVMPACTLHSCHRCVWLILQTFFRVYEGCFTRDKVRLRDGVATFVAVMDREDLRAHFLLCAVCTRCPIVLHHLICCLEALIYNISRLLVTFAVANLLDSLPDLSVTSLAINRDTIHHLGSCQR